MNEQQSPFLLVGLGNPGSAYQDTRHNIGFRVLEAFAKKRGWSFRNAPHFQGDLAQGTYEGKKLLLLLPMTYMNSSGEAVRLCVEYFKVSHSRLMVVSDDIALDFGTLRIKPSGSSGGHNGLKSIESHLGTQVFPRFRIGIGDREHGDLGDYVLARFKEEERSQMPSLLEKAVNALEIWLKDGIVKAMDTANGRQEEKKPEQKLGEQ